LPGLVEASRRGGHLWFFFDVPILAVVARRALLSAVDVLCSGGLAGPVLPFELYPDTTMPGVLGHAVRLPLGIHRLTGRRYPLFDAQGYPCAFTSTAAAIRFILAWPRIPAADLLQHHKAIAQRLTHPDTPVGTAGENPPGRAGVGTHSPVIRWVDA